MKWRKRTLDEIAGMICGGSGNSSVSDPVFRYRSSSYLTRFFQEAETDFVHGGESRISWVADVLEKILAEPHLDAQTPPAAFCRVIQTLMDPGDATGEDTERKGALERLNTALAREGFEAFYAADRKCYLRHSHTGAIAAPTANPHRPFSSDELARRGLLAAYLDKDILSKITQNLELWHYPSRYPCVSLTVDGRSAQGDRPAVAAHREHWPINSIFFRDWLSYEFFKATDAVPLRRRSPM